jgi:hypothetical protein
LTRREDIQGKKENKNKSEINSEINGLKGSEKLGLTRQFSQDSRILRKVVGVLRGRALQTDVAGFVKGGTSRCQNVDSDRGGQGGPTSWKCSGGDGGAFWTNVLHTEV